jgi:hypothetical protein
MRSYASERTATERVPRRYLVVANLRVSGDGLAATIEQRLRAGPCTFHVVVPASADPHAMTWTEEEVMRLAGHRLDQAVRVFRNLRTEVSGEVGDWTPLLAIEDALRTRRFDEIILSTLPPGLCRWIRLDMPRRIARRFGLPVSHVVSSVDRSPGLAEVAA